LRRQTYGVRVRGWDRGKVKKGNGVVKVKRGVRVIGKVKWMV